MRLTLEQTNKILTRLSECSLEVVDTDNSTILEGCSLVSEEYFNKKVNEALEE